ncbi:MAG: LPS export ABC transporter periplasmic protein LptC [Candidatus Omnitrophica bacterium]|nr:LPS export ABC transporter periplasmic protein LptC [Candidatus Omnitrophota bacterium]
MFLTRINIILIKRFFALLFTFLFLNISLYAQEEKKSEESDQQISDFSLAGYGEKGDKSWDLAGKSADIFTQNIKLKDVEGNLYGETEDINLTAEKGDFNKNDGRVHLEENVVVTTSTGAKLTTDSLDWDRKQQIVSTEDLVNIEKENMTTTAKGAIGKPDLNNILLKQDVTVTLNHKPQAEEQEGGQEKMVITCDGPLEIDYDKNIAIFNNNVVVTRPDSEIYSDIMHVYFIPDGSSGKDTAERESPVEKEPSLMGSKIDKIIARGNVKIVRGENVSYSQEAVYTASNKTIVLTGRPKLVLYSQEDLGGLLGGE